MAASLDFFDLDSLLTDEERIVREPDPVSLRIAEVERVVAPLLDRHALPPKLRLDAVAIRRVDREREEVPASAVVGAPLRAALRALEHQDRVAAEREPHAARAAAVVGPAPVDAQAEDAGVERLREREVFDEHRDVMDRSQRQRHLQPPCSASVSCRSSNHHGPPRPRVSKHHALVPISGIAIVIVRHPPGPAAPASRCPNAPTPPSMMHA